MKDSSSAGQSLQHTILIKLGGRAAAEHESLEALIEELAALAQPVVLVHGGGAEVSALSEKLGMKAVFENGIRMTSPAEMDVVDMVLSGRVNSYLVRSLCRRGIDAVGIRGIDGRSLIGRALRDSAGVDSHTGTPVETRPALLRTLLAAGYLPIVSPTSMDATGRALNINADESALALAEAIRAHTLLFLSDVPGVLDAGKPVPRITPEAARSLIAQGVVSGGMIPKLRSALHALDAGVGKVVIGRYETRGDLHDLIDGRAGTTILGGDNE